MKLYATVTSERARKGQGGNEYIEINITADRKSLLEISVSEKSKEWVIEVWDRNNKNHSFSIPTENAIQENMAKLAKGKKQNGDTIKCNNCGWSGHEEQLKISGDIENCPSCGSNSEGKLMDI